MAVAEARAAWQRTLNRCLVQEDAKRAPKLACCPSASQSQQQVDVGPAGAANTRDAPSAGFLPFDSFSSHSNLSPNSRWWLKLPPTYVYQRGLSNDELKSMEEEKIKSEVDLNSVSDNGQDHVKNTERSDNDDRAARAESFLISEFRILADGEKNCCSLKQQELKADYGGNPIDPIEIEVSLDYNELGYAHSAHHAISKKSENLFDTELASETSVPWWRTADGDELALLVAQRSLDLIDNCDLPQPQITRLRKESKFDPYSCNHGLSLNPKLGYGDRISLSIHRHSKVTSTTECHSYGAIAEDFQCYREKQLSGRTLPKTLLSEDDQSKAKLLEALRHSQTRAREAEKAVKQAYSERDHIVKLVFKQASQLFAYRQWFHFLQLENLYFQIKNSKTQPISSLFPVIPWVPQKRRKTRKNWQKGSRVKQPRHGCSPRHDWSTYAVVFALGLSLVGAGLLLGWTVGWLFPTF